MPFLVMESSLVHFIQNQFVQSYLLFLIHAKYFIGPSRYKTEICLMDFISSVIYVDKFSYHKSARHTEKLRSKNKKYIVHCR